MRLATWNVNGLRARLDFIALWLKARDPDVVGLQELKMATDEFPYDVFTDLGYNALVHGQKGWNGVAILTREPAELIATGLEGEEGAGARLISARIRKDLEFTTVYCPNGKSVAHEDFPKKLVWYDSLVAHLGAAAGAAEQRILCGDFNVVPKALDSWRGDAGDGEVFHTSDERQRFAALLDLGFEDLYRRRCPAGDAFSWWDYRGGAFHRNHGLRIDFILGSPSLSRLLEDVVIDRDFRKKHDGLTASDHAPVYADLAL